MNRCLHTPLTPPAFWRASLFAALLGFGASALAQDTVRPFPANAKRGVMQITQPPELLLDGVPDRLSPGSRIRGTNNMLVLSATLAGQTLLVNYVREPMGLIHEVWVLTEAEAKVEPVKR